MKSILNLRSLLSADLQNKSIIAAFLMVAVSVAEMLGIALLIPIIASIVGSPVEIKTIFS